MENNAFSNQESELSNTTIPVSSEPSLNIHVKTSSLYDQGFNKKTMFFQYFFVRIWPVLKLRTEETVFFIFKVFRSFIKFAMAQMGIRS